MPKAPQTFGQLQGNAKRERYRGSKQERGYGGEWERISKMYRQEFPVCQVCDGAPSVDTDHIIPFNGVNDPLRTDWNNLQAICRRCHNVKTHHGRGMHPVTWVCGDPGTGKTTYVKNNRRPNDITWDMDEILSAMCPAFGRGQSRPNDVMFMVYEMRQQLIKRVRSGLLERPVWFIWADINEAMKHVMPGNTVVLCEKRGDVFTTSKK